ncbi:MAG: 2-oxoacid:acceptor oxidoreductase family protein [Clostridiales Family XIII bacterium]|nr:2-oxoacid:acceptor oxidoreductase family protein [Clostridiales Family XIII bacterium]
MLLADVAFTAGMYVQGFPEYGPERMGAPITAYNRLDDHVIRVHSNIYEPDIVVVVDETLIKAVDVTAGLKPGGKLLINSKRRAEDILKEFPEINAEIYVIDAADISIRYIGKNIPNSPLLSAVARLTGLIPEAEFMKSVEEAISHKFASKPAVIQGNVDSIKESWNAVIRINE